MNKPVIPEIEWAIMTPEEKAAIMFPDMSTLQLNNIEKKHVYEMFECKCSVCLEPFDDCDEFARVKLINYYLRNKK